MTPDAREAVERERDALEHLAESDLPADWIAEQILDAADSEGSGGK